MNLFFCDGSVNMSWRPGRSGSFRRFETVLDKVPIEVRLLIEEIEDSSTLLFFKQVGNPP